MQPISCTYIDVGTPFHDMGTHIVKVGTHIVRVGTHFQSGYPYQCLVRLLLLLFQWYPCRRYGVPISTPISQPMSIFSLPISKLPAPS